MLLGSGKSSQLEVQSFAVQQIIDLILKRIPNGPFKQTIDTLTAG
jgi:hypothetical protein